MPLHTIPLCNFKYARDVYSSANFKYDTTCKIEKEETKLFYKSRLVDIDKIKENKLLYINLEDVLNKEDKKYLYKENSTLNKELGKEIELKDREIKKVADIQFSREDDIEFNKNKSIEIKQTEDIDVNKEPDRILSETWDKEIFKSIKIINLNKRYLKIDKQKICCLSESLINEIFKNEFIGALKRDKTFNIDRVNTKHFKRDYFKKIVINKSKFHEKYYIKHIEYKDIKFIDKIDIINIDKQKISYLYKDIIKEIKNTSNKNISKISNINLDKTLKTKLFYRDLIRNIFISNNYDLDRNVTKSIFKDVSKKYFYREALKEIYYRDRLTLDRDAITLIFKNDEKYLNYIALINIYKQIEKDLLDLNIWNIYKEHNKSLNGTIIKGIYKNHNCSNFIEITKRWWWLKPTTPTDKLIVPNKDYERMKELLENPSYEYLRFNNHPIEWGTSWGIDYNIPPIAVSIEIMVDLVNILIMLWHKNTQAWLNCSGKEAIQFIMELFYDWYTMDTSKPNTDYYRAYRWIRWEAEKVYFLDTKNGLQAIGMLIANLIDYIKYHHFDLVPLWGNPKAMDIERNFNRIPKNGDLMKDLDKLKGNRHYMIETQNFEKKNILGR